MAVSRFALTLDEPRRARLKSYARSQGVSAAAVIKAFIDRLPGADPTPSNDRSETPKTNRIHIRLTDSELADLDQHVSSIGFETRTSWLTRVAIQALNKSPIATMNEVLELRRSRAQLAAVGRNLNQIARALNIDSASRPPNASELAVAIQAINEHKAAVIDLVRRIENRGER